MNFRGGFSLWGQSRNGELRDCGKAQGLSAMRPLAQGCRPGSSRCAHLGLVNRSHSRSRGGKDAAKGGWGALDGIWPPGAGFASGNDGARFAEIVWHPGGSGGALRMPAERTCRANLQRLTRPW